MSNATTNADALNIATNIDALNINFISEVL